MLVGVASVEELRRLGVRTRDEGAEILLFAHDACAFASAAQPFWVWMFAALMILVHWNRSTSIIWANSLPLKAMGSKLMSRIGLAKAGSLASASKCSSHICTMADGVAAGANMPYQFMTCRLCRPT